MSVEPAAGIRIARKIKLIRERRVRLLLWSAVYYQHSLDCCAYLASFAIEAALNPLLLQAFPESLPGPEALASNPWVRALMFAYGLMCVATGGYIAARVARRLPVTHASVMGVIQASLTIVAMLSPGRELFITIAVDHNCCPEPTCSSGGRSCLQRPQTE